MSKFNRRKRTDPKAIEGTERLNRILEKHDRPTIKIPKGKRPLWRKILGWPKTKTSCVGTAQMNRKSYGHVIWSSEVPVYEEIDVHTLELLRVYCTREDEIYEFEVSIYRKTGKLIQK